LKTRNSNIKNNNHKNNSTFINNIENNSTNIDGLYKKLFYNTPSTIVNEKFNSSKSKENKEIQNLYNIDNSLNKSQKFKNQNFGADKSYSNLRNSYNVYNKNDSKVLDDCVYIKTESDTYTTGSNYIDTNTSVIINKSQNNLKSIPKHTSNVAKYLEGSVVKDKYLNLKFPFQMYTKIASINTNLNKK
jgi:predicted RND superfamily exporter protein